MNSVKSASPAQTTSASIADLYPLSPMQQGILFHVLLHPEAGIYLPQLVLEFVGELDAIALRQAWQQVVAAQAALRTAFRWENHEQPFQVVYHQVTLPWQEQDWRDLPLDSQRLATVLECDRQQKFDLKKPPLMRLHLIRATETRHYLIWTQHHLILDGWSAGLVLSDVFHAYYSLLNHSLLNHNLLNHSLLNQGTTSRGGLPPRRPYRDYIAWRQQQNLPELQAFWRKQLEGFTAPAPLPIARSLSAQFNSPLSNSELQPDWMEQQLTLPIATTTVLRAFAKQYQLTLNTVIQGAFALLLSRYTDADEICFGMTHAGRPATLVGSEAMIGLFINTLPMRVDVPAEQPLTDWLRSLQNQQTDVLDHDCSLSDLQQWCNLPGNTALFDSILVFENYPVDINTLPSDSSLQLTQVRSIEWTSMPITLLISGIERLTFRLKFDRQQFEPESIDRLLRHLQVILENFVAQPKAQLASISLLTEAEIQQLNRWNATETIYSSLDTAHCLPDLFEAQVERTPDAIAVCFAEQQLTYAELNSRANQLAHQLLDLGTQPETVIGICADRSLELAIGLLAILKAGAAYLPLDPSLPRDRLNFMLSDAQATLVLSSDDRLPNSLPILPPPHLPTTNPQRLLTPAHPVSVLYTSGSTGTPKGVVNTHQGIVNRLCWMQAEYRLTAGDRVLQKTPLSFDVSVWEIFWTWLHGACLVLAKPEGHRDSHYLADVITEQQITTLHFVPSMLQAFLDEPELTCTALRAIFCSGEVLPPELAQRCLDRLPAALHNLYGPTEAAIDVTFLPVTPAQTKRERIAIGRPIANTQLYIVDRHLHSMPIGIPGELIIGGIGLARGYVNRPQLTAETFIPNPFSPAHASVLYRTGDRARYLADGTIEFLGRRDQQIKLRGLRIELGEIEATLQQHSEVKAAAVVLQNADNPQLVAYIVPRSIDLAQNLEDRIANFLATSLPNYMIPARFITLDAFPLLPNGKLDRRSLPTAVLPIRNITLPRNATETAIAAIWQEVLKLDKLSIDDSFFALGGNSLLATRINSRLRQAFRMELPLRLLFEKPTIATLAEQITLLQAQQPSLSIAVAQPTTQPTIPAIVPVARDRHLPLSFAQQRLWFLEQLQPHTSAYNVPIAVRLSGHLEIPALERAVNAILTRHEILRTNFRLVEGEPVQVIAIDRILTLPVVDLQSLSPKQQEVQVQHWSIGATQTPFDLAQDSLLRLVLLRLSATEHVVLLTLHHIVTDAWSMDVLLRELVAHYKIQKSENQKSEIQESILSSQPSHQNLEQGTQSTSSLPALPIQYADFAIWQRQWLQGEVLEAQLQYWRQQLQDLPVLQLPTDFPRSRVQGFHGGVETFSLSPDLSDRLKVLAQNERVTLFMTLLAAYQVLLYRYTGQPDIVVGSPIANRHRTEVEGLIGFFVNTLVLRTKLAGQPSFREVLQQVRQTTWDASDRQDLPFEKLVEVLQPERDLSYSPLFQVKFRLENLPTETITIPGLMLTTLKRANPAVKLDLSLDMYETPTGLVGSFEYNADLFAPESIQRLVGHFCTLLAGIVAHPEQPIATLPLLTSIERQQLQLWNQTETPYDQTSCFHHWFEAQVDRTPDAIALIYQSQQLTYAELNCRANQLAHYLQSLGAQPETLIGLCIDRSPEMIVGLLAILKAGAAYLPLDPAYPSDRLQYMLEDAQASILVTTTTAPRLTTPFLHHWINLDTDRQAIASYSEQNPVSSVTPAHLAYLIYTSGSTGKPKGVLIPHSGLVNLTADKIRVCQVQSNSCILQFFSLSFDASVPEIVMALASGAKLCLAPRQVLIPGEALLDLLRQQAVTHITITPSALSALPITDLPALEMVLVGGEAPAPDLITRWSQQRLFINAYGPTEVTVNASMVPCGQEYSLQPTLRPSANKQLYVLDDNLQPVPIGVIGELHIGGVGLARGYWHRSNLTAERFIPRPPALADEWEQARIQNSDDRLYKTGDLATFLPDGGIKLLGRIDDQVKIRGFRIEPGEIEMLLTQHPQVQSAAVLVRTDIARTDTVHTDTKVEVGEKRLVAYIVSRTADHHTDGQYDTGTNEALADAQPLTHQDMRRFLKEKLPDYMIPSIFVFLDKLPLTPNGKIDRTALPIPDTRLRSPHPFTAPRTSIETQLVEIFKAILQVETVSIDDDFFDLGGHSLLATRLIAQTLQTFQVELTVADLFTAPTIAELGDRITTKLLQTSQPPTSTADREEIEL